MLCHLHGKAPYPSASSVDQDPLTRLKAAVVKQRLPGGQCSNGNRCSVLERYVAWRGGQSDRWRNYVFGRCSTFSHWKKSDD